MTPEQHADNLTDEIRHELKTYGYASLAAVIATILENEEDIDCSAPPSRVRMVAKAFRHIEEAL